MVQGLKQEALADEDDKLFPSPKHKNGFVEATSLATRLENGRHFLLIWLDYLSVLNRRCFLVNFVVFARFIFFKRISCQTNQNFRKSAIMYSGYFVAYFNFSTGGSRVKNRTSLLPLVFPVAIEEKNILRGFSIKIYGPMNLLFSCKTNTYSKTLKALTTSSYLQEKIIRFCTRD